MLESKIVLVAGAFGLLGREIVKEIVLHNGFVIATDKDIKNAKNTFQDLPSQNILFTPMDITDSISVDKAIKNGLKKFGSIDCCINAAYPKSKKWGASFEDLDIEDIKENFMLQLGGAIILSQRILKSFILQGYGNFINISSIQGVSAPKFEHYTGTSMTSSIIYSAVKSGIISITSWLSKYYKNKNIRVNCVSPGGILDKQPKSFLKKYRASCNSKGMLDSKDIVGAILFLISDHSKYINGQNIIVDDGWTL